MVKMVHLTCTLGFVAPNVSKTNILKKMMKLLFGLPLRTKQSEIAKNSSYLYFCVYGYDMALARALCRLLWQSHVKSRILFWTMHTLYEIASPFMEIAITLLY